MQEKFKNKSGESYNCRLSIDLRSARVFLHSNSNTLEVLSSNSEKESNQGILLENQENNVIKD